MGEKKKKKKQILSGEVGMEQEKTEKCLACFSLSSPSPATRRLILNVLASSVWRNGNLSGVPGGMSMTIAVSIFVKWESC